MFVVLVSNLNMTMFTGHVKASEAVLIGLVHINLVKRIIKSIAN